MNQNEVIFVADYFAEDLKGGAELTSQALIDSSPFKVKNIRSQDVNYMNIALNKSKLWILTNISKIPAKTLDVISKNLKYVCVEYDFKFCPERSLEKYKFKTDKDWTGSAPEIRDLLCRAQVIFFMSQIQKEIYRQHVEGLDPERCEVLSSVFSNDDIFVMRRLRGRGACPACENDRDGWLIVYSDSWVKGSKEAVKTARTKALDFRIVEKLDRQELLRELVQSEGLIYTPAGADTCPRLVIEARLLGCQLELNDNVLHAGEDWFNQDPEQIESYLETRPEVFWSTVKGLLKQ